MGLAVLLVASWGARSRRPLHRHTPQETARDWRIQILDRLVEGMASRPLSRAIGVSPNTVNSSLISAGRASANYHDLHVRNVRAKRVQADETWSFIYAKQAHVKDAKSPPPEAGDVWPWNAIDTHRVCNPVRTRTTRKHR